MTDTPCPSDESLRRALASIESGVADGRLQAHLDRCQDCQDRLERLAGDSITGDMLHRALAAAAPTSPKLMDTIERLSSGAAASGVIGAPRYDDLDPWIESSNPDDAPTLDGYVLLECIGRGGMGVVFRAFAPAQDRVVALKAMLPELARDDRARERFLREARAIAAVQHPNVVALHAVSEVNGLPYLIMDYVEGASLEDRMRNDAPMAPQEIARIGAAVAAGLAACHEKGVIHRDIKPSNVLLCEADGAVKITDFGLAAVASTPTLTHNGYLSGTPDYVAPERLAIGSEADERSDLFSLGCLLYTMATGEEPFGGDTPLITLHRIATEKPTLIRVKNPSVPAHLEKTIASLMAKRPQDRPESANAAQALLLEDGPKPRSVFVRKRGWVAGLTLLSAALAVILYTVPPSPPEPPAPLAPLASFAPLTKIVVTTAAELENAVETVPDGGRIELDTDQTLAVRPLYIAWKSVTIAAAEGREPKILLQHSQDDPAPEYLLRLYYGTLNLSGLRLEDDWEAEEQLRRIGGHPKVAEQFGLLSVIDGDLNVEGCRFETRTVGSCVKLDPGNAATLRDTEVFAPNGTAITWHAIEDDGLVLDHCVVAGNVALLTVLEGNAEVTWERSIVLANIAAFELQPVRGQLSAWVSDCVIQSVEALVLTALDPPSLSRFKQAFAWHGSGNQIRGKEIFFADGEYTPSWAREVTAWAMGDPNSTYGRELFHLPHRDVVAQLIEGRSAQSLLLETSSR